MYRAPGTGKNSLALWIAHELGLPVVIAKLDGLVSSSLGAPARNIGNLFNFANRYDCILLIDEFDAIAKVRDDPQGSGEIKRVVNVVLQNLDARRYVGFTIGITNHSRLLDKAVWRGFEAQLDIPKPDFDLPKLLAARPVRPVEALDSHLQLITWFTDDATGGVRGVRRRAVTVGSSVAARAPSKLTYVATNSWWPRNSRPRGCSTAPSQA
ncbi:ATP-binding protein [Sphingomonas faeni]